MFGRIGSRLASTESETVVKIAWILTFLQISVQGRTRIMKLVFRKRGDLFSFVGSWAVWLHHSMIIA
ncbi:hypothetical protein SDJN03_05660, partial [Cucurbita argyrosperma subsp. sororia]